MRTAYIKALAYIYRFLFKNVYKWPRWVRGNITAEEKTQWEGLKAKVRALYGLTEEEANTLFEEALESPPPDE